jgi:hypothetical protein
MLDAVYLYHASHPRYAIYPQVYSPHIARHLHDIVIRIVRSSRARNYIAFVIIITASEYSNIVAPHFSIRVVVRRRIEQRVIFGGEEGNQGKGGTPTPPLVAITLYRKTKTRVHGVCNKTLGEGIQRRKPSAVNIQTPGMMSVHVC